MGTSLFSLLMTIGIVSPSGAIIAAGIDYAGIGSLVAALAAFVALFLSHNSNKKNAKNTETVSYVDNNLKTMQASLDWEISSSARLREDNAQLRKDNEDQRKQLEDFADELNQVQDELAAVKSDLRRCRDQCAALILRVDNKIGKQNDPTD